MAASFLSEHSAEYILVPRIVSYLKPHFRCVIPIYFWSTREGSSIAGACEPTQPVRVINIFARRPKVSTPNQESIEVKFNQPLFQIARLASTFGISTLAGVPIASSIFDISLDTECAFFELFDSEEDFSISLSVSGNVFFRPPNSGALDLIRNPEDLLERVLKKCVSSDWRNMMENLRELRRTGYNAGYGHPVFSAAYRPFHLLLLD